MNDTITNSESIFKNVFVDYNYPYIRIEVLMFKFLQWICNERAHSVEKSHLDTASIGRPWPKIWGAQTQGGA